LSIFKNCPVYFSKEIFGDKIQMSKNITLVAMYHRHKLLDLIKLISVES
jgi:hypothetical protein